MIQIQVSGPAHSKKGYAIVAIVNALRDIGADVHVLGEHTHLADKMESNDKTLSKKLEGQVICVTELRTGV